MNDVRDICERMLVAPPPLREGSEVLDRARRSAVRRRRTGLVSAGLVSAGLVAVAATAATALAVPSGPSTVPARPASPADQPAAVAPAVVPKEIPLARASFAHGARMRELLLAAVPAGYATSDLPIVPDESLDPDEVFPNESMPAPKDAVYNVAAAGVLLDADGGQGLLMATIFFTSNAPVPCSQSPGGTAVCEVVTFDGVNIEVTTWSDEAGQHISARRPLRGGFLSVTASQGLGTGDSHDSQTPLDGVRNTSPRIKPPLPTLPFDKSRIAALALNPAMLQFP